jgi:hypothetical protein
MTNGVIPHTVDGRDRLTEAEVREYLTGSGYEAEADTLIAESLRIGNWHYTADRHRCIHHEWTSYPDGYWTAADTEVSEERIKAIGRRRRRRGLRFMPVAAFTEREEAR